jgi:hypothetical protein
MGEGKGGGDHPPLNPRAVAIALWRVGDSH